MTERTLRTVVIVSVCYIAAQIFADITSLRIVLLAGWSVDAGTIIYPFTFTLRDMIHKIAGVSIARTLIFLAAGINIFMAFLFWLVAQLPADPYGGLQTEYFATVLAPVTQIVLASILAEVVAELLDTEAYRLWEKRFGQKHQWGRVLVSNAVSLPIDSAIFVIVAFTGILSPDLMWNIFLTNIVLKGLVTLISIPGIYMVRGEKTKPELETT